MFNEILTELFPLLRIITLIRYLSDYTIFQVKVLPILMESNVHTCVLIFL